jgi:hypothetical protein
VSTTINSTTPFLDPVSGQMVTTLRIAPQPGSFHLELGYDYSNRVRTNDYLPDTAYDGRANLVGEAKYVRVSNQSYTEYDSAGAALPVTIPDGAVTTSPLAPLGAFNYRSITAGVFVDTAITQPGTRSSRIPLPAGARMSLGNGGNRLTISTGDIPAAVGAVARSGGKLNSSTPSGARGNGRDHGQSKRLTRTYEKQNGRYVLAEVRSEVDEISAGKATVHESVITFRNVQWHINPQKDAERDSLLAAALAAAPASCN